MNTKLDLYDKDLQFPCPKNYKLTKIDYCETYCKNKDHCDIYAWNLALDNGLDPTKGSKEIIDLNQNTVRCLHLHRAKAQNRSIRNSTILLRSVKQPRDRARQASPLRLLP